MNDSPPLERIAFNIKRLRVERRWTLKNLGEKSGVAALTISRVERADGAIKLSTFLKIINALEVSFFDLFEISDDLPRELSSKESHDAWINRIANWISNERREQELSLRQFAAKLNISYLTLWRYEQGSRDFSLQDLLSIVPELDLSQA